MRWCALWLVALVTPALAAPVPSAPVTVSARAVRYQPEVRGWAKVEPKAPLVLRATIAARVTKVTVVPGQAVRPGEALVTFAGPRLAGELSAARVRSQAAQRELAAAQRTAAAAQRTFPVVTDRAALDAAQAGLAAAQGESAAAEAALATLQAERTLGSPVAAVVSAVHAAPGADVPVGTPLVTVLPDRSLWLRVELFEAPPALAAITAQFLPADGGAAIAVREVAELPARAPDGARVFNFAASGSRRWQAGETGELVWQGLPRRAVAIPSEALVLNAGRWYVLTDIRGKLAAQAVTPGPTRGTDVLITHGLHAGEAVVVRQAYLLFHRHFSAQYAPLD